MSDPLPIDSPDRENYPPSGVRRRVRGTLGCLTLLILLAVLAWFVATHTGSVGVRTPLGP